MSAASDFDRTQTIQHLVSDPASSAWVVANAGSGKTHVLTQRVIRLLLAGADPAAILCLTFTKIAAAEMARRVFGELGKWVSLQDADLSAAIAELQGRAPTIDEMRSARRLFASALETPGGLKIQTIHAFCERLLHQFPFEANVPGQFAVLDDSAAAALIATARAEVMNRAAAEPATAVGCAIRYLAERATDMQIGQALDAVIAKRDALRRWMDATETERGGGDVKDALADLRRRLGLASGETEESICGEICQTLRWRREDCGALIEALHNAESSTDRGARLGLAAIFAAGEVVAEADGRLAFFLTDDRQKARSAPHRFGAAFRRSQAGVESDFAAEAERLLLLAARLSLVRAYDATDALLIVGDAILQGYHAAKRRVGALDFADLVAKTRNLLSRAAAAEWVLYKLDQRIEHILVDEAQDTSPDQWAVVRAIADDFFSGASASTALRTIFAVGDDKQSIFGFQGAEPRMLAEMQRFFAQRTAAAATPFVAKPLFLSFRSTREVLTAVDHVFNSDLAAKITASTYEAHASYRDHQPGHVVIMPRVVRQKVTEPEDWTAPYDAPSAAETELAGRIADEISRLRNTTLPSGKRVRDGGILILVRRRDALFAAMNRALRARQIPTAGADRLPIATHIAVLDLLALADVMLLPEDDLQLAALLKSPLLGIGEDVLMHLAAARTKSLWSALQEAEDLTLRYAAEALRGWRAMADQVTPFRFFATVLGPDGGRRAFRARLGGEADDVIDAFLSQALAYENVAAPALQSFVRFIRSNESDLKRETEEKSGGVRVMTVHGAKGIEADVVFLVDTGGLIVVHNQRDRLVAIGRDREDPAFLWRRLKDEAPEVQRDADAEEDSKTESEYLRLLYVAMTRARDVLYIAGIRGERTPPDCWYSLVRNALAPTDTEGEEEELSEAFKWPQPARPPLEAEVKDVDAEEESPHPPDWLSQLAPSPKPAPAPLRPSSGLAEPDPLPTTAAANGPAGPGDGARVRGRVMHLVLQVLPGLSPTDRERAADRILATELARDPELARSIWEEVTAVLAVPALQDVLGPNARSEVAIVGRVATEHGDYAVSGRIDRLVRDEKGWHIVDFKTDRAVPAAAAEIDPASVLQLALYRRLLIEIEPEPVNASLVFTAGPNVMPIPTEMMEQSLAGLGIHANPVP